MEDHLKSYLTNSTAHGFRYLVVKLRGDGEGGPPLPLPPRRMMWFVAIALSFTASAFLVASSIRETKDHPVMTTTAFVPIQVPAVGNKTNLGEMMA